MKKMHFKLIDGENLVIDESINCIEKAGFLKFSIDDDEFYIRIVKEQFCFLKKNNDSRFKIENRGGKIICEVGVQGHTFDINVLDFKYNSTPQEIVIEYKLESDYENVKKIILIED